MGNKKNPKPERMTLIPFDHAVYTLRVPPDKFHAWLNAGRFTQHVNTQGQPCIDRNEFKKLAESDDVHRASVEWHREKLQRACAASRRDEISGKNAEYRVSNGERLRSYRQHIQILEEIHASYHSRIDVLGDESALVAAYILYSRVINLLNMACLCLENGYWNSGILLRLIDETVDLARYFVLTEATEQGQRELKEWFRCNTAPGHKTCRKELARQISGLLGQPVGDQTQEAMDSLYERKSKWIHPTYNAIMEVYRPKGEECKNGFDYGVCANVFKILELTDFFRSSVWTAVQGFLMCFNTLMPLDDEHSQVLYSLDDVFKKQSGNRFQWR